MANLTESSTYEAGIYQLETSDPVIGGAEGISNLQAKQLANRTKFLKDWRDALIAAMANGSAFSDDTIARARLKNGIITASVRNCIQSGPVDSNGAPTAISGTLGSATVNINGSPTAIRLSFAYGFDDRGQVDFHGKVDADSTLNIGAIAGNANVFVYFERNVGTGNITVAGSVGPFIVSAVEPALGDRKYWFNTNLGQWLEWTNDFGGSWAARQLVIAARVVRTVGGLVSEVIPYKYGEAVEAVSTVPAGTIMAMAVDPSEPPTGWVHCDGSFLSRTVYSGLYNVIGTTFGSGSGTFKVPDLRGEFIRGLDDGRGVDTGRALGSSQAAKVGDHKHQLPIHHEGDGDLRFIQPSPFGTGDNFTATHLNGGGNTSSGSVAALLTDQPYASSNAGTGDNRPRNVALPFFIKY